MKGLLLIGCLLAGTLAYTQEDRYTVSIDLNSTKDDKLYVSIKLPKINEDTVEFHMPKIVPGTYSISDFGKFVTYFQALDSAGVELQIDSLTENRWLVKGTPATINYWINDTFDWVDGYDGDFIFEPGGTSFEPERDVFVLNTFGIIGYVDNYKFKPFDLRITHSENIYGSTSLKRDSSTLTTDYFTAENYNFLADAPIMYNEPDTTTQNIAGADILISVYSPGKKVTSVDILSNIGDLMLAQSNYLGGELPVDRYAYLIYLMDYPSLSGAMGALEHSYSSLYTLPENVATQLPQFVRDIAAHEFLHIVTPLNIHSEQIHNFNYIEPEMSKHLWLYEGVTEYSAMHVQVREGLYDTEDFLAAIQGKIESAKEFPLVSFTEMSERILEPDFEAMYGNVYEKGALIALCLDLYLIKYSNGNIDLPTLLHDLANDYGPNKAFDDASFVETLTQLTYPEVGNFLNKYVVGDQPLPIDECLLWAGVAFQAPDTIMVVSFGNVSLDMNQDNLIIIANINAMDEFGTELDYQKGDILHSVNGQEVTLGNITMILDEFQKKTKEGEKVKIEVIRNVNEKVKVVKLKAKAITFPSISNELLIFIDNPAESQKLIRSAWISGINK